MDETRSALLVDALQLVDCLPPQYRAAYEEAICDEELLDALQLLKHLPTAYSPIAELVVFCAAEVTLIEGFADFDRVYGVVQASEADYNLGGVAAALVEWTAHGQEVEDDWGWEEDEDDYDDEWDEEEDEYEDWDPFDYD